MELIDTHQHLWDLDRFPYSWCAGIPALNRSFRYGDYARAASGLGITKTVFVECDVDDPHALEEARMIQAVADEQPSIGGIVASARPERDGFREHLEQLALLKKVRGIRRVLHTQPDELSQSAAFAKNLNLLPGFGFTFDLCVLARQLPQALVLIRRCPKVSFILDHCGVPDVRGGASEAWHAHIAEIAGLPNAVCKISGLVAYADPKTLTMDVLKPWVEHVIGQFGWERVVWGGDWPVCTLSTPLAEWVRLTRELTASASESDRSSLFHLNARRVYRL